MPCCGKKRKQVHQETKKRRAPQPAERTASQPRPEPDGRAYFQYLGKTGLTVIGPRTHRRYRFDRPGVIVAVDPRDGRALAAVSVLRQVRKPTEVVRPG
jgi:non-ribosomal peptide synthetase component E (peptide arylation enzyme)